MSTPRQVHTVRLLWAVLGLLSVFAARVQAAPVRVLVVTARNVSDDAQAAIESAVNAEAELVDPSEYQRLARAAGQLPTSEAALERVAPRVHAQLIIVATKAGGKLVLIYRDGASGEVLRKDSVPERHRGAAGARFQTRVGESVHRMVSSLAASSRGAAPTQAPARDEAFEQPQPTAADEAGPESEVAEPSADASDLEPAAEEDAEASLPAAPGGRFAFEVSAGLGGAMRQSVLPTRLGLHELDTGLFPGVSLGLLMAAPLGNQGIVRASVDYRTSLGLQGTEKQREPEMSTPLRSHAVGVGIAPGYRFGAAADSVSLLLHLGWYWRGLRPIAQLALPEVSWHAAVVRPELNIPVADGAVTLRIAPELLVIAGLYTTLPDASGMSRTGFGYGGELSIDVRVAAPLALRLEYRESHAAFSTAWSQSLTDVERFAALRAVLSY